MVLLRLSYLQIRICIQILSLLLISVRIHLPSCQPFHQRPERWTSHSFGQQICKVIFAQNFHGVDHPSGGGLPRLVISDCNMLLFQEAIRHCTVLNDSKVISAYQWSRRHFDSQTSHHVSDWLHFFNSGSHTTKLSTISACLYGSLVLAEDENWRSFHQD